MRFCEKCGTYMERTSKGFHCPRCGHTAELDAATVQQITHTDNHTITVVDEAKKDKDMIRVREKCPKCGNPEAFRSLFFFSGEHAGTRQERSVAHFKCTKCKHSWSES